MLLVLQIASIFFKNQVIDLNNYRSKFIKITQISSHAEFSLGLHLSSIAQLALASVNYDIFLMYRSDGKEVLIDNKELKANYPLLVSCAAYLFHCCNFF